MFISTVCRWTMTEVETIQFLIILPWWILNRLLWGSNQVKWWVLPPINTTETSMVLPRSSSLGCSLSNLQVGDRVVQVHLTPCPCTILVICHQGQCRRSSMVWCQAPVVYTRRRHRPIAPITGNSMYCLLFNSWMSIQENQLSFLKY